MGLGWLYWVSIGCLSLCCLGLRLGCVVMLVFCGFCLGLGFVAYDLIVELVIWLGAGMTCSLAA